MKQTIAQARHSKMMEDARNEGWIDGWMDINDGSWTRARYRFPAYKAAYHEGLKQGISERQDEINPISA